MKQLLFLFVLAFPFLSSAQDYSGMYPGSMHFYSINSGDQIYSIREDSSYYSGIDLIKIYERNARNVLNENLTDTICFEVGGMCELKLDGSPVLGISSRSNQNYIRNYTALNDSLTVNFNCAVSDTQLVYQDDLNKIRYVCIDRDSATLFGLADSIIVFKLFHFDTLENPIASPADGDTIIYSKNVGLYKGFALDSFPYVFKKIQLEGIRNPAIGFDGLTMAELYNYQVGDQMEVAFNAGPYSYNEFLEVLSRTNSTDSVFYSMYRIYETRVWNFTWNQYDTTRDTSIVVREYSKTSFIDESDYHYKGYNKNGNFLNGCINGYTYNRNNYTCAGLYCPSLDCYYTFECTGPFYNETFFTGVGMYIAVYSSADFFSPTGYYDLIYLKNQNLECGSSYILSDNEINFNSQISIYPNPTNNFVTINSEKEIKNGKIILTDISGREINQYSFNNKLLIDLSGYSKGIYFIQLYSGSRLINNHKLIRE